jgi:translocator protein
MRLHLADGNTFEFGRPHPVMVTRRWLRFAIDVDPATGIVDRRSICGWRTFSESRTFAYSECQSHSPDTPMQPQPLRGWQAVLAMAGALLVTFAAANVGAMFQPGAWYEQLRKPALTPPGWVFGPVWTLLYLMMGVAAGLVVWRGGWRGSRLAIGLYVVQLALNAAWSWLFFGLQRPAWAMADLVLLWLAIAATIEAFRRISLPAAALLVPYLAWVSFAAYLNLMIWRLNP